VLSEREVPHQDVPAVGNFAHGRLSLHGLPVVQRHRLQLIQQLLLLTEPLLERVVWDLDFSSSVDVARNRPEIRL